VLAKNVGTNTKSVSILFVIAFHANAILTGKHLTNDLMLQKT